MRGKDLNIFYKRTAVITALLLPSMFLYGSFSATALEPASPKATQGAAAKQLGLFGSKEIKNANMKAFSKWTSLWRRYSLPKREGAANAPQINRPDPQSCPPINRVTCKKAAWDNFIQDAQSYSVAEKLKAVNAYLNQHPYIVDPVNWGLPDYWATPDEFFMKDGDCEDYAISKYITLKRLGVDANAMRLVVVQDENLNTPHAVLAVNIDGEEFVLDNQVDAVLPHTKVMHYRPVYSINEQAWWLHQRARKYY